MFLEADRLALGGEKHSREASLFPRSGILHVVVNKDARLADEVNLFTMTDDADEAVAVDLRDELGEPINLARLAVLIRRLGEDVNSLALGDEIADGLDVLGKRLEICHRLAVHRNRFVLGVSLVEVGEHAVHVEVVSHCFDLPSGFLELIITLKARVVNRQNNKNLSGCFVRFDDPAFFQNFPVAQTLRVKLLKI